MMGLWPLLLAQTDAGVTVGEAVGYGSAGAVIITVGLFLRHISATEKNAVAERAAAGEERKQDREAFRSSLREVVDEHRTMHTELLQRVERVVDRQDQTNEELRRLAAAKPSNGARST